MAAFFVARADLEIELSERAFRMREAAGDTVRAAYLAVLIARKLWYAGKPSMAAGWIRRAQGLAGDEGETYAHGYLALAGSEAAAAIGDLTTAERLAERAIAIASGAGDPDLGPMPAPTSGRSRSRPVTRPRASRCWRRHRSLPSTASCRRSPAGSRRAG